MVIQLTFFRVLMANWVKISSADNLDKIINPTEIQLSLKTIEHFSSSCQILQA